MIKIMTLVGACLLGGCTVVDASYRPKPAKKLVASVYWQDQGTFCGGRFNPKAITFADRGSKCGTRARITADNGRSVIAVRNDKGPFVKGRHVDLSDGTAKALNLSRSVHLVNVEYLD